MKMIFISSGLHADHGEMTKCVLFYREGLERYARNKPVDEQIVKKLLDSSIYIESDFRDETGIFRTQAD